MSRINLEIPAGIPTPTWFDAMDEAAEMPVGLHRRPTLVRKVEYPMKETFSLKCSKEILDCITDVTTILALQAIKGRLHWDIGRCDTFETMISRLGGTCEEEVSLLRKLLSPEEFAVFENSLHTIYTTTREKYERERATSPSEPTKPKSRVSWKPSHSSTEIGAL